MLNSTHNQVRTSLTDIPPHLKKETLNLYLNESKENCIGFPGKKGFGIGIYPYSLAPLPQGISKLFGTDDINSDLYGNYRYEDYSMMCWIPKFYYKLEANNIEIASALDYPDVESAALDGFALHRAFIDGDVVQTGFFVDKYLNSIAGDGPENATPSSLKNGRPFTFDKENNPFPYNFPDNDHVVEISKKRGEDFFTNTVFIRNALALLSLAHGQASTDNVYCSWYDEVHNYPKGCNTEDLSDIDDPEVIYEEYVIEEDDEDPISTGYPKTGSASVLSKTTHNGQNCGVADLNGVMGEYNLGLTNYGISLDVYESTNESVFYILKESVRMKDLTGGFSIGNSLGDNNAWGNREHIESLYHRVDGYDLIVGQLMGNEDEVVFSPDLEGEGWMTTCAGLPLEDGFSERGTDLFGKDFIRVDQSQNRLSVANFDRFGTINCGVFSIYYDQKNTLRDPNVGIRLARYAY